MPYELIPDAFPVLRSEGLTLRETTEADLPAWFARLSDPEAAALAGDPLATSMQDAIDGLAYHRRAFAAKEGLRWAIVPPGLEAGVGSIGFVDFDAANRNAEVGAAIGRAHWNRSLATSATRLVAAYGFTALQLGRIEAKVMATNGASIRVLEKVGFRREAVLRSYRIVNGVRTDFFLYSLLPADVSPTGP